MYPALLLCVHFLGHSSFSLQGRELERGVESNKADLEAKSVSEAAKQLGSEVAKCNILISPLEGEKKFLSELCELRNFREGYKKYKNSDRATGCAMTCFLIHPTSVIADFVPRSIKSLCHLCSI